MKALGDKIESKKLAEEFDVPVSPWCLVEEQTEEELVQEASRIGYPLMVKASAGGEGEGFAVCNERRISLQPLRAWWTRSRRFSVKGASFSRRALRRPGILRFNCWQEWTGKRLHSEYGIVRFEGRNQKVIEEGPSPIASKRAVDVMCEAAVRLAEGVGYRGAGTAEYLYKPETDEVFFLEVNSRLQVSTPLQK